MANFLFIINTVFPVFLIISLGIFLKKIKLLDDNFISMSSNLVFKVALPALTFSEIAKASFSEAFNAVEALLMVSHVIFFFVLAFILAILFIKDLHSRGPFIQGCIRGNVAIITFAIILNIFNEKGLAHGALLFAFVLPLYNIFSVIALVVFVHNKEKGQVKKILFNIITNPLIISVIIALPFSIFQIKFHPFISKSISYLSNLTLPLALICVGGSLSFKSIYEKAFVSIFASVIKILIMPVAVASAAYFMGIRGEGLCILYLITGAPTAFVTFVMADSMNNDGKLAANIIALSTLGSIFTTSIGIFLLKTWNLF
jgi:malonate transporter